MLQVIRCCLLCRRSHEVTIHKQEKSHEKNEFMRDMDALDNPEGDKTVSISQSYFSQTTHDLWLWRIMPD